MHGSPNIIRVEINKDSNAIINLAQKVLFILRLNTNDVFYKIKSPAAEITVCTNNKNEKHRSLSHPRGWKKISDNSDIF